MIRIWDVEARLCVATLVGHTAPVACLVVVNGIAGGAGARVGSGF